MSKDIQRMLKLAAKAMGLTVCDEACNDDEDGLFIGTGRGDLWMWAPHNNDGEAFRLQVAIRAELKIWPGCELLKTPAGAEAWVFGRCFPVATADGRRDEEALRAAARLAIVNAAAYVGESMP